MKKSKMIRQGETTIHHIAEKLGISASTVSRALKDNTLISLKMRELVKKTAQEMGYSPNILAASFRTRRTNTLGVIVPWINRHFFSSVISGIEDVAYNSGFTVTIAQSNDNYTKEASIAQSFFANRIDGLLVSIAMQTTTFNHFKLFKEKNIPIVFFDRIADEIESNKIVIDDYSGGYKCTRHLADSGRKRIAHIGGLPHVNIYRDRLKGYLDALIDSGLTPDNSIIIQNNLTRIDGFEAIKILMRNGTPPDAVFCANDMTALSVILYLKGNGINVPEDISVVGFSNEPFSEVVTPSISTILQPAYSMGQKAAEMIIEEINNSPIETIYQTVVMPADLVIRESSMRKKVSILYGT
jgi:LacI family transcriptional regulator